MSLRTSNEGGIRPGKRQSTMRGAVLYGAGDLRFEERDAPTIIKPTDALIRMAATCVCGSDLWPYRGLQAIAEPTPMGHEYLRRRRRGRQRCQDAQAWPVRHRLLLHPLQYVAAPTRRLSERLPPTRVPRRHS